MKHLLAACLLAVPALLPAAAQAQSNHWSYVGAWDVDYYPSMQGCGAMVQFEGGTSFLIGFDTSSGQALLAIGMMDTNWTGIKVGNSYDLTVRFDSRAPWDVTATGVNFDGTMGLVITEPVDSGNAASFAREFQRSYWMSWTHRGDGLGKLSLKDSHAALNAALDCSQRYLQ